MTRQGLRKSSLFILISAMWLKKLRACVNTFMCEKYLSTKAEQGKKLDFYSQELLREYYRFKGELCSYHGACDSIKGAYRGI